MDSLETASLDRIKTMGVDEHQTIHKEQFIDAQSPMHNGTIMEDAGNGLQRLCRIRYSAEKVAETSKEYHEALKRSILSMAASNQRKRFIESLSCLNDDISDLATRLQEENLSLGEEFMRGISIDRRRATYFQLLEVILSMTYDVARVADYHGDRRSVKNIRGKVLEILQELQKNAWTLVRALEPYVELEDIAGDTDIKTDYAITRIKRCREVWTETSQKTSDAIKELSKAPATGRGPPQL